MRRIVGVLLGALIAHQGVAWAGNTVAGTQSAAEATQAAKPDKSAAMDAAVDTSHVPETVVEYRTLGSEAEVMQLCEAFLGRVMRSEYDAAFDGIRPYFPISAARFDKLRQETKKQHGLAQLQFGKPIGYLFVRSDTIKDTVVKYRFLEKFEWDVMYWEFLFYKPQDGWILNGVGFDDELHDLFRP